MRPKASFIFLNAQENPPYTIEKDKFSIGRSKKLAEFSIQGDPHISRVQAEVEFQDGRFLIRNLGRNPLVVNGRFSREHELQDGDVIRMGLTELRFAVWREGFEPEGAVETDRQVSCDEVSENEKTKVIDSSLADSETSRPEKSEVPGPSPAAPRLVRTDEFGQAKSFTLDVEGILIGRTLEADIRLNDPSVSRRHCAISKQNGVFYLQNLSNTNPVRINDREAKRNGRAQTRLYSGDRIRIGENLFAFVSDSPENVKPPGKGKTFKVAGGTAGILAAASLALIVAVGAYFAYARLFLPYKQNSAVESAEEKLKEGLADQARDEALGLLKTDLSAENRPKVQRIVAESTEYLAMRLETSGNEDEAKKLIESYLKDHGATPHAQSLRTKLDEMTIRRASALASKGLLEEALGAFSSISHDSLYYETAQSNIDELLQSPQLAGERDTRTAELIETAERLFSEGKYSAPPGDNAYEAYMTVVNADPGNETALNRIRQIKEFYRQGALNHYDRGNCRQALPFFRDFLAIEPEHAEIREKYELCRKRLGLE